MLIWTSNEVKNPGACQEYRIRVPANSLFNMFEVQTYEDRGENPTESLKYMFNADVIQLYSLSGSAILHRQQTIQAMAPAVNEAGVLRVPPAFVYDCDDNTDFVHPFNNTFAWLGVRAYPDARLLKPGDDLEWKDDHDRPQGNWIDGQTHVGGRVFSVERNLLNMKIRHEIIRNSDGATASSKPLADYFKHVCGQKHVYVYPNTVVPEDYPAFRAVRKDTETVRILWQGSSSHLIDWYPLRHAVKAIAEKYGTKIKFVIFGEKLPFVEDCIPPELLEFHGWVDYSAYKLYRGLLNCDINLCPLANNAFNRCKSAIKWYEASVWDDQPEATLAQSGGPYDEITDGVNGLLFSNPTEFVEKLSLLIEDAQLRKTLAQNAHEWVMNNRLMKHTTPGLHEFYQEVRARQVRERTGRSLIKSATDVEMEKVARSVKDLARLR